MNNKITAIRWVNIGMLSAVFSAGCLVIGGGGIDTGGPAVSIGGTVNGLDASDQMEVVLFEIQVGSLFPDSVTIRDIMIISENGEYSFSNPVSYNYEIKISNNPTGKLCTIDNPTGPTGESNVISAHINCGEPLLPGLLDAVSDQYFATCINQRTYTGGYSAPEEIDYLNCNEFGISEVSGLHFIPNLSTLRLRDNNITSIDLSDAPNLSRLELSSNNLQTIDTSKLPNLVVLEVRRNELTSLDVSANTLVTDLDVRFNNLSTIDLSNNTQLYSLDVASNNLSTLNVSASSALRYLYASINNLGTIDLLNNSALTAVDLHKNALTSIDLSNLTNVRTIDLAENALTAINLSNLVEVNRLELNDNLLTNLNNIPLQNFQRAPRATPIPFSGLPNIDTNTMKLENNPWDAATLSFIEQYAQTTPFDFSY